MTKVLEPTATRKHNVTHYAYLGAVYGTAELLCGSGYLFRAEGERQATLVSSKDPELMLLGLCALAEMQADLDTLLGGAAAIACSRSQEVA